MTSFNSCILAVDAGGTSLKAALFPSSSDGNRDGLSETTFFSVNVRSEGTKEEILTSYEELGRKGTLLAAEHHSVIEQISVCIPGPFDYKNGCSLMTHKYQSVYQIPLGPEILKGAGVSCPITFLHDSTAFLLGAALTLPEKAPTVCGVIIGTGLGFACMSHGVIQENPSGGPGVSIYARPYLNGTAEDYVSKRGILRRYLSEAGIKEQEAAPTVAEIAGTARNGDPAARKAFADTGFHLGQILLPVLREHPFKTVLLGGAISKSADLFLPELNQVLSEVQATAYQAENIDHAPLSGAARYRK